MSTSAGASRLVDGAPVRLDRRLGPRRLGRAVPVRREDVAERLGKLAGAGLRSVTPAGFGGELDAQAERVGDGCAQCVAPEALAELRVADQLGVARRLLAARVEAHRAPPGRRQAQDG